MTERYMIPDEAYYVYSDIYEDNELLRNDEVVDRLNKQEERIKELEYELSVFKPVVFQDTQVGTVLLYAKDYGDVE